MTITGYAPEMKMYRNILKTKGALTCIIHQKRRIDVCNTRENTPLTSLRQAQGRLDKSLLVDIPGITGWWLDLREVRLYNSL